MDDGHLESQGVPPSVYVHQFFRCKDATRAPFAANRDRRGMKQNMIYLVQDWDDSVLRHQHAGAFIHVRSVQEARQLTDCHGVRTHFKHVTGESAHISKVRVISQISYTAMTNTYRRLPHLFSWSRRECSRLDYDHPICRRWRHARTRPRAGDALQNNRYENGNAVEQHCQESRAERAARF